MLKDAQKYNIDLSSLESLDGVEATTKLSQQNLDDGSVFLESVDVKLKDMCNKIFVNSERLIFVIRDDTVEYANDASLAFLHLEGPKDIVGKPFLGFVAKSDWNLLALNIGEMLTSDKRLKIQLSGNSEGIFFDAVYLPDSQHFSFILVSEILSHTSITKASATTVIQNNMFDVLTGLPSFQLFEDRLQMAINHEIYKDSRLKKNFVTIVGVNIKNATYFQKNKIYDFIIKKTAQNLIMGLKKSYTVAKGVKYPFWILLNDVQAMEDLNLELEKIEYILSSGIKDNFTEHFLEYSIAIASYPKDAESARKLLEVVMSRLNQKS